MRDLTIHLSYDPKPIPDRHCDWTATIDGQEELGSGFGSTAAEALRNLADDLEARGE
jgi:hypothetical protein